jgi:hypothetical protein
MLGLSAAGDRNLTGRSNDDRGFQTSKPTGSTVVTGNGCHHGQLAQTADRNQPGPSTSKARTAGHGQDVLIGTIEIKIPQIWRPGGLVSLTCVKNKKVPDHHIQHPFH